MLKVFVIMILLFLLDLWPILGLKYLLKDIKGRSIKWENLILQYLDSNQIGVKTQKSIHQGVFRQVIEYSSSLDF